MRLKQQRKPSAVHLSSGENKIKAKMIPGLCFSDSDPVQINKVIIRLFLEWTNISLISCLYEGLCAKKYRQTLPEEKKKSEDFRPAGKVIIQD